MLYLIFRSRHLCLVLADPSDKSHPTSARSIESSWGQISRWTWNQFAIKFSCLSQTIRGILITSTLGGGYYRYWHSAPTINFIGNLCLNAGLNENNKKYVRLCKGEGLWSCWNYFVPRAWASLKHPALRSTNDLHERHALELGKDPTSSPMAQQRVILFPFGFWLDILVHIISDLSSKIRVSGQRAPYTLHDTVWCGVTEMVTDCTRVLGDVCAGNRQVASSFHAVDDCPIPFSDFF